MKTVLVVFLFWLVGVCYPMSSVFSEKKNQQTPTDASADEIIKKMFQAADNIKSLKYVFISAERIEGKVLTRKSYVKIQTAPRKLFFDCKDAQVLWSEGNKNNEALVHPYGFPYFNVNLEPNSSFLRKDQHHSILEIGYAYFINIIKANAIEKAAGIKHYNVVVNEEKINNRDCFRLTISYPDFAFVNYKVQKNEDIISIARKLNVSEYMILENNPKYSSYTSVDEGDIIKVPNAYSKMSLLFIDKQNYLPIVSRIYDDKGLFESYEYNSLEVNSVISAEEFTKQYKDYHF